MSVQADAASKHEDLSDLFQRLHIIECKIIVIGHKEEQNTLAGVQKSPDGQKAAEFSGCSGGQILVVEPCDEKAQQADDPVDVHMVSFQHGRRPQDVCESDQQRNAE